MLQLVHPHTSLPQFMSSWANLIVLHLPLLCGNNLNKFIVYTHATCPRALHILWRHKRPDKCINCIAKDCLLLLQKRQIKRWYIKARICIVYSHSYDYDNLPVCLCFAICHLPVCKIDYARLCRKKRKKTNKRKLYLVVRVTF